MQVDLYYVEFPRGLDRYTNRRLITETEGIVLMSYRCQSCQTGSLSSQSLSSTCEQVYSTGIFFRNRRYFKKLQRSWCLNSFLRTWRHQIFNFKPEGWPIFARYLALDIHKFFFLRITLCFVKNLEIESVGAQCCNSLSLQPEQSAEYVRCQVGSHHLIVVTRGWELA